MEVCELVFAFNIALLSSDLLLVLVEDGFSAFLRTLPVDDFFAVEVFEVLLPATGLLVDFVPDADLTLCVGVLFPEVREVLEAAEGVRSNGDAFPCAGEDFPYTGDDFPCAGDETFVLE